MKTFKKILHNNEFNIALIQLPLYSLDEPPFGLACLKAYLLKNGINAKCFDLNLLLNEKVLDKKYWQPPLNRYWWDEGEFEIIKPKIYSAVENFVKEKIIGKYNLVGLGISTFASYTMANFISGIIKKLNKNIIIIGGGMGCLRVYNPLQIVNCQDIDVLIGGEGEKSLKDIIFHLKSGKNISELKIAGCYIKKNKRKTYYIGQNLITKLDELPPPDYSDFNLKNYTSTFLPMETSRGCINKCTFCSEHLVFSYYRSKSAKVIFNEIMTHIKRYNVREFFFKDSLLNGNLKELEAFCDLAISSEEKFSWTGQILIREMSSELVRKMKLAGLIGLAIGLESGSQNVLDKMNKRFKVSTASKLIKSLSINKIETSVNLIVGFPGETDEDFLKTVDFLSRMKPYITEISEISMCHLDWGSKIRTNYAEYNISEMDNQDCIKWTTNDNDNNYKIRYIRCLLLMWYVTKMKFKINQSIGMKEHLILVDKNFRTVDKLFTEKKENITLAKMRLLTQKGMGLSELHNNITN